MTRPTVVLVQNSPTSTPGRLPEWLDDAGVDARVVQGADLADRVPALTGDAPVHGLVLLGGGLLPDEDERAPWLPHERALTAAALDAGVPLLGICLGAQVLAHVTGGEVTGRSGETEKGMCPVDLLETAADDALLRGLHAEHGTAPGALRMIEHHVDSITQAPPGAVLLATSAACRVQAFRVGPAAWGVQFHPEAPADRIGTWDAAELAAAGYDRAAMQAEATAHDATNTAQARALTEAFAGVVHRYRAADGRVAGRTRPRRAGVR